jgi:hypothetical protein
MPAAPHLILRRWRRVQLCVLVVCSCVCRSTARLSSGQRTALNDVVEARTEERNGQTYFVYEHTSQVRAAFTKILMLTLC